jgi:hypothetical protein
VTQEDAIGAELQPVVGWQLSQVAAIFGRGVSLRVLVTDGGKVVVAWIGITAATIIQAMANRMIVVPLDALDVMIVQERENSIGIGSKCPKITEAVEPVHLALLTVVNCRG